jgi:hypothetical protein
MNDATLGVWRDKCLRFPGGPFWRAGVFVDKKTDTATVVFHNDKAVQSVLTVTIGGDTAHYLQIGEEIVAIVKGHRLLGPEVEVPIYEGRLV